MDIKLIELTKICTGCEKRKSWKRFDKKKTGRYGISSTCKICCSIQNKIYRKTHKKEIAAYIEKNKEKRKIQSKKRREITKKERAIYRKKYNKTHKEQNQTYRKANKEKERARARAIYKKNKKTILACIKKRHATDLKFKLNKNISRAIQRSLKEGKGAKSWKDLVSYTIDDLKKHIKKRFTTGMTWEKFLNGEIHIDHKIPISAFNFTKPEHRDFKRCWALKNLQPMWAKDNLKKGMNLIKHFQPSLLL